jgi:hypothetical protein
MASPHLVATPLPTAAPTVSVGSDVFSGISQFLGAMPDAIAHVLAALIGIGVIAELIAKVFLSTSITTVFKPTFEWLVNQVNFLRYWLLNLDIYFDVQALIKFSVAYDSVDIDAFKKELAKDTNISIYQTPVINSFDARVQNTYDLTITLQAAEQEDTRKPATTELLIRNRLHMSVGFREFHNRLEIVKKAILSMSDALSESSDRTKPTRESVSMMVMLSTAPEMEAAKAKNIIKPKVDPKYEVENLYVYVDTPAVKIHFKGLSSLSDKPVRYLPLFGLK